MNAVAIETAQHDRWPHLPARPWTYVGCTIEKYQACQGAPIQPGASCDHCSTAIMEVHHFRARDGRRFKVGCDCVFKMVGEMRTASLSAAERAIKKARNAKARERAAAKRANDRETLGALLADNAVRAALTLKPHPFKFRAEKGETLLDWADWMHRWGGGKARAATISAIRAVGT